MISVDACQLSALADLLLVMSGHLLPPLPLPLVCSGLTYNISNAYL